MPEMHFQVRWPDGEEVQCYSPSSIIKDYLQPGREYPLGEFLSLAGTALQEASERVRQKYGFACSSAMDQWQQIQQMAEKFRNQNNATVAVIAIR